MLHVAEAARVSVATVSAYINGTTTVSQELSARIEQAIREIGYKRNAIARSLKVGTTRTVGLTVPHITNPFFTDVVSVIQQAFDRAGYAVMLCCTDEDLNNQDDQIRLLLDRMVDGLIVARVGDSAFLKETVNAPTCRSFCSIANARMSTPTGSCSTIIRPCSRRSPTSSIWATSVSAT